jgi:CRISPR type III-B/RAMP module RAMP protein Cmr1
MHSLRRSFSLLTPGFPHGAYQSQTSNVPELRAPSVRGQIRWWFDALHPEPRMADAIFGKIAGGNKSSAASLSVVRVSELSLLTGTEEILPHKPDPGDRGPKQALLPGSAFTVDLTERREGLTERQRQPLERALEAWLLFGGIGQRANRAAGSVWPDEAPADSAKFKERADDLLKPSKLRAALLDREFGTDFRRLRRVAGDIIHGPSETEQRRGRETKITAPWWPFGAADEREPSPLKLKAVRLDGSLRLCAVWDGRRHTAADLRRGVEMLRQAHPAPDDLGELLTKALPLLAPETRETGR